MLLLHFLKKREGVYAVALLGFLRPGQTLKMAVPNRNYVF